MKAGKYLVIFFLIFTNSFFSIAQKPELVIPVGNPAEVTTIAYSPDGKYIASGGYDQCIKLWYAQTGENIKSLEFHNDHVTSILFTPDSLHIISAGRDKKINCFNFKTGELSYSLTKNGHTDCISSLNLSKDGHYLLSGSWDGTAKLWDTYQQKCIRTFHCGRRIQSVHYSRNNDMIFIAGKTDSAISVWNVDDTLAPSAYIHFNYANAGSMVVTDSLLLCGSNEVDTIYLLNLKKLKILLSAADDVKTLKIEYDEICIKKYPFPGGAYSLALSNSGNLFTAGEGKKSGSEIYIWSLSNHETTPLKILKGHEAEVRALCFSPGDKNLLSGSYDMTMILWDYLSDVPKKVTTFQGHTGIVRYVEWTTDDKNILIGYQNSRTAILFNVQNNNMVNLTGDSPITGLNFSPDNNHFILVNANKKHKLWEIDSINYTKAFNSKSIYLFTSDTSNKVSYILSKGGDSLITCDSNKVLRIVDLRKNDTIFEKKIEYDFELIDFSYDLEYVVYTDSLINKSTINVLKNESLVKQLSTKKKFIINLMLSFDKKYVIALSYDSLNFVKRRYIPCAIDIWDMKNLEEIKLSLCDSNVNDFRYFPNTELIFTSRSDGTIDLWDLASMQYVNSYYSLNCATKSIFISNNKKLILLGGKDGKLIFIDYKTQKELATLTLLDSTDWVVTTPSGLYDATPGALEKMHYIVDLTPVKLSQLKHEYSQANLLKIMLGYNGEQLKNIIPFDSVAFYPKCELSIKNQFLIINLKNQGGGFGKVSVFLGNNKIIDDATTTRLYDSVKTKEKYIFKIDLNNFTSQLYDSINVIKVICENEKKDLKSLGDTIHYNMYSGARGQKIKKITGSTAINNPPSLYALIIGTSHYANSSIDLLFADKDAIDFGKALENIGKNKFDSLTYVKVLSTDTSTTPSSKDNILQQLKYLSGKVKPRDIFILYFSGHGSTVNSSDGDFYYMTREAKFSNIQMLNNVERNKAAISTRELKECMDSISAQNKILIVDACESGNITQKSFSSHDFPSGKKWNLEELSYNTGTYVLAGSLASQSSYETSVYKQGLLTYSLLQGIKGVAALNGRNDCDPVNIKDLFDYAIKMVPVYAKKINGIQQPIQLSKGTDITIGCANLISRNEIKIVENVKMFSSVYIFPIEGKVITDDTFNLARKVKNYLMEQTVSPVSQMAFISSEDYPDSYSIKGSYILNKNLSMELRYKISQNNRPINDKSHILTFDKSELDNLAVKLMKQVLIDIDNRNLK